MAYKTLDEAFKDTFTSAPARTVSMDEAFKATFGEAPPKPVSLDEAFENTFGQEPVKAVPDHGSNYGGRSVRGVAGGLLNSAGAGTLRAVADFTTKAGRVVPDVKYDPVTKKIVISDELSPTEKMLRDNALVAADRINKFSEEMIANGLAGQDPTMLDKIAQGVGSTAGFMIPSLGLASKASKAVQAGNLAKAALFGGIHGGLESAVEGGETFAAQKKQSASDAEATAASTRNALMQFPINFVTDTAGSLIAGPGGGVLRSALGRGVSEGIQEPLQGVLSDVTSKRKEDGTPMTWGDLFRAVPEMAKAFPDAVFEEGVPAAISAMIFGAGEGLHNRVTAKANVKQDMQTKAEPAMTLDEAFESMQAVSPTLRVHGTQVADDLERMALNTGGTSPTAKGVASVMDDLQGVGSPPSVGQGVIPLAIGPGDLNSLAASLLRERGNTEFGRAARMMSDLVNGGKRYSVDDVVSILRRNPSRRIDSGSVIDQYGESALDSLPLGTDSAEGKTSIDELASQLGYKNRDSLIADLSAYRKKEAQLASQAIQNELGMSPEDVVRYTGQAPQDAEWPYSDPSLQVTPEQRRAMEFDAIKRDAAATASTTPGTRENALGWIRKNGGLDYRAIRDSYGREEALQLRKRLGPGVFKENGMPLDKAAQGLSLEGATGLDSDVALFQTLMGEDARIRKESGGKRQPVAAIRDQAEKNGALTYEAYGRTFHRLKEPRYSDPSNKTTYQNWVRDDLMNPSDELADESVYRNRWGKNHAEWRKEREGTQVQALVDRSASNHAMDKDVDLGTRVPIFNVPAETRRTITTKDRQVMSEQFGNGIENADTGLNVTLSIGRGGAGHIAHTAFDEEGDAKQALILADPKAAEIRLYDQKIGKKISGVSSASKGMNPDRPTVETAPDTDISLGEMAVGVKDTLDDRPYLTREEYEERTGNKYPDRRAVNVEGTEDSQFLPSGRGELRAFEPPIMERPEPDSRSDNPVKVGEIKDAIDKIVPWRFQKVARGTLGQFKVAPEVTRTKYRNDVTAELHELGHYLDKRLGLNETQSPPALQELAEAGAATSRKTYTPEQVRDEGIAQFFLNYAVDREAAREQFPAYFEEFEAKLVSDPELKADVDRVVGLASSYLGQNAGERMNASIVRFDERQKAPVKERAKRAFDRFYENFVDSLDPLQKVSDSLREQLGVEHLPDDVNIIAQARTMPGYKGKMAKGVSAFFDVIRELGPQDHDALNAYLASARAQDYRVLGMEPGLGRTAAQDARTIREAPQHIREAAEKLYGVYSDVLAKTLVETGMITRETQEYWKKRWPHYVPFIRIDSSRNMDADVTSLLKGGGRNIVNIANPIKTTTGVADAAEVMNIADPLSAMLRNIDIFHSIAARNEVGKTLINVSGIEGMGRFAERVSGPGEKGDNVFYVWNGGKKEYYATDPDVYRALASLGESPGAQSFILRSLRNVAEWFKMGTTRYNPAFALFRNLPRDSVESTLNSKNKWAVPVANTIQGVVKQFSKNPKTQAAVQKAIDEGILYSSIVEIRDNSWEGLAGSLSKAFKEGGAGVKSKRAAMDALEIFGKLNEAVEIAPKVQEYFYLTSHGVPEKEAVMRSRQVNIDFARSGRIGKVINRYIPFFNASIQGTDKTLRNVKENPKAALAKAAVWIGGPSLLTWALGTFGGDDDDKKEYAEIPLEQKDRFWFAKMGGQWVKIPKPQLYGAVGSLVERVLEKAYRDNPVAFDGFLSGIADEVKPSVLPAIFLSSIEATTDYNFYTGRQLVPRSLSNLPPEMQYTDRTSEISKAASRLIYNATGDSVSPIKIDHMLRSIGGTMGTAAINTTNRLFGKDEPIHGAVTGVFTRSLFTDPNKSSASVNRFYDVLERTEDEATRYKARRTAGESGEPNRDVRFAPVFARQAKSLSDLRKRRAAIQEHPSLSPASKRKYLDEMDERMVDLARGVLERYDKYGK